MDTSSPQIVAAYRCSECSQILAADALCAERVYVCGECGQRSEERRCDQCNRFCSRVTEPCCPDDYADCDEFEAAIDNDGTTLIDPDNWEPTGTATERADAKATAAARKREAEAAQKAAEMDAATELRMWETVAAGDVILLPATSYTAPRPARVLAVQPRTDGMIQITFWSAYTRITVVDPTAQTRVFTSAPTLPADTPDTVRGVVLVPSGDADVFSSPSNQATISVGEWVDAETDANHPVDAVALQLGSHGHGVQHPVAVWTSRAQLLADCALIEQAARDHAARRGAGADPDTARTDVQTVHRWTSGNLPMQIDVQVTTDLFSEKLVIGFSTRTSLTSCQSAATTNPAMLVAACEAARAAADTLPD